MIEYFERGGPVMWPLSITSVVALSVVIERMIFIFRERLRRQPDVVGKILTHVERGEMGAAVAAGERSEDFVARVMVYAMRHGDESLSNAILRASNQELRRFNRGLAVLDTIITLAPLLGLLGTVTGMIRAFGLIGGNELGTPIAITGGIAEALLATAFGLGIAITALIPFNYLNSRVEQARHDLEDCSSQLELLLRKSNENSLAKV